MPASNYKPLDLYDKLLRIVFDAAEKGQSIDREWLLGELENEQIKITPTVLPTGIKTRWTVPFRTLGEDFRGRQESLQTLHGFLDEHDQVGITGMGGLGKTQLAVEYAARHKDDYPQGIFWFNAVNPLLHEFAVLAKDIGLVDQRTQPIQAALSFRDYLKQNPQALVVFDNLDNPHDLNKSIAPGLIPSELSCRILFTTRNRDFPQYFFPYEIPVLSPDASRRLLLCRYSEVLDPDHPEFDIAEEIVYMLGRLPLALELASAFLGEYSEDVSLTDYLHRLKGNEELIDVLDDTERKQEHSATHHIAAVGATFNLQWEQLEDEIARRLFTCAGILTQADWIPTARLGLLAGVEIIGSPGKPAALRRGLKKLMAKSLIEELTGDRLRLHPLIHEFARNKVEEGLRIKMACNLANTLVDMRNLEVQVSRRGVAEIIKDLSIGFEITEGQTNSQAVRSKLDDLKRVLDREAHHLRDWNPDTRPSFLLQQIAWRAHAMNRDWLAKFAEESLETRKLTYLKRCWGALRESPGLLRILKGETSNILSVAMTSNGKKIASGSFNGSVQVWDVNSGKLLWVLDAHNETSVRGVSIAQDASTAVSGSIDGTLQVWDINKQVILRTIECESGITAVEIQDDGYLVAAGLQNGIIQIWDLGTQDIFEPYSLKGHQGEVRSLAFLGNYQLVSGSSDDTLRIWDLNEGKTIKTLDHGMFFEGLAVSRDLRRAVSVGHEGWKIWDFENYTQVRAFRGKGLPLCVTLSNDSALALVGTKDLAVEVWDLDNLQRIDVLEGHDNSIFSVALSPDGTHVVSASNNLFVWDITAHTKNGKAVPKPTLQGHKGLVSAIAMDPNANRVVSGSWDGTLRVWDSSNGNQIQIIESQYYPEFPNRVAMRVDGSCIVVEDDGWIKWNSSGNKTTHQLTQSTGDEDRHFSAYGMAALSGDGRFAIGGNEAGNLIVWNLENQNEPRFLCGHQDRIEAVVLTYDGTYAASLSVDGSIILWNLERFEKVCQLNEDVVLLTTNGLLVVAARTDHDLIVWNTEKETRQILAGHTNSITGLAITKDGRNLISASTDGTARIWDLARNREIARFDEYRLTALGAQENCLFLGNIIGSLFCLKFREPEAE